MGTAELKANFPSKRHELTVSTYQMVILLLFNDRNDISFKEMKDVTNIPIPELKRNLLALSAGKYKVLTKSGEEKGVAEADVFSYNSKFKSQMIKIKIMAVVQKETETETKDTRQKIDEDRKHMIEAAIVRVMKARKTMDHNNLITEVTNQLSRRFMPNPTIVKKRIESLIEREYLERSKTDRKVYNYLA